MRKLKKPEGSRILKVDGLLVSSKSENKKKINGVSLLFF
jgi:hypothetical protein